MTRSGVSSARPEAPAGTGSPAVTSASANPRAPWKAVALPAEHGGWGLTLEPCLLGVLVAPSLAGAALAAATFLAFLVRTPLKLAVVDRRRGRRLGTRQHLRQQLVAELGVAKKSVEQLAEHRAVLLAADQHRLQRGADVAAPIYTHVLQRLLRQRDARGVQWHAGAAQRTREGHHVVGQLAAARVAQQRDAGIARSLHRHGRHAASGANASVISSPDSAATSSRCLNSTPAVPCTTSGSRCSVSSATRALAHSTLSAMPGAR